MQANMPSKKRLVIALVTAPIVMAGLFYSFSLLSGRLHFGDSPKEFFALLSAFSIFYIFVGLPLLLLLRYMKMNRLRHFAVPGAIVGLLLAGVIMLTKSDSGRRKLCILPEFDLFIIIAALGAISTGLLWLIVYWAPHSKSPANENQIRILAESKPNNRTAHLFMDLTIITASWLSLSLALSGVRVAYRTLENMGFPSLASLLNLSSEYKVIALLKLSNVFSLFGSTLALLSAFLLQVAAYAIRKEKRWALREIVLATSFCFAVYAVDLIFLGLRQQLIANTLLYIAVAYLYSVPMLPATREKFGLKPLTIRAQIGLLSVPIIILCIATISYVGLIRKYISPNTISLKLAPLPDVYAKWHEVSAQSYTWDGKWSFYIPNALKKSENKAQDSESAAWKSADLFILLSANPFFKEIWRPYYKSPYDFNKAIWSAGYWGGLTALGLKEFLAPSNEIYDLDQANVKAIICLEYRQNIDKWFVKAEIYPANQAAFTYTAHHKTKDIALAPLLITLKEYQNRKIAFPEPQ